MPTKLKNQPELPIQSNIIDYLSILNRFAQRAKKGLMKADEEMDKMGKLLDWLQNDSSLNLEETVYNMNNDLYIERQLEYWQTINNIV